MNNIGSSINSNDTQLKTGNNWQYKMVFQIYLNIFDIIKLPRKVEATNKNVAPIVRGRKADQISKLSFLSFWLISGIKVEIK